jgi:hypothetical protein
MTRADATTVVHANWIFPDRKDSTQHHSAVYQVFVNMTLGDLAILPLDLFTPFKHSPSPFASLMGALVQYCMDLKRCWNAPAV